MANCKCCGKENARYVRQIWTAGTLMQFPQAFCNYKCANAYDQTPAFNENNVPEYGFSAKGGF